MVNRALFCFFFVKQKTAYEMRISDWSSDVCSSDLTLAGFVLAPFGLFGRTAFLAERVLGHVMATGVKVLVLAVIIGIGTTIFDEFEIGRASCRERVCQYV